MPNEKILSSINNREIRDKIYTFRGKQVMVDRDLAELYHVETKVLNQAVKRNINRFPNEFRFQLDDSEKIELVTKCDQFESLKYSKSNPYVFTEQGIAMLSAILKSEVAVKVSIKIMNTFVEIRKFFFSNRELFVRLDRVELKQLETDQKIEKVFNYLAINKEVKQKIFYNGQIYDAFSFIVDIIKKAKNKLILIDNYVDTSTLNLLCKKNKGVTVIIASSVKGSMTSQDISIFNSQYQGLTLKTRNDFHDRFIIIDDKEVYHIGASLKDAGKKSFGITKIEDETLIESLIKKVR